MGPLGIIGARNTDAARLNASETTGASKNEAGKIANAASQFEALLIGQILKSAHGSGSEGWLGSGEDDDSSSTAISMAEEYLGQALASGGGLGIAKLVVKGIGKNDAISSSSVPSPANSSTFHTDSKPE